MIRSVLGFVIFAAFVLTAPLAQSQMTDAQKMERNKRSVVEFYNAVLNGKDFEKAKTYVGATYIQHNPIAPTGLRASRASSISCARNSRTTRARPSVSLRRATM
jgi:hypothetical protein